MPQFRHFKWPSTLTAPHRGRFAFALLYFLFLPNSKCATSAVHAIAATSLHMDFLSRSVRARETIYMCSCAFRGVCQSHISGHFEKTGKVALKSSGTL